ncbi:MAG: Ig domain-containing protein [Chloroflexota bacterium]
MSYNDPDWSTFWSRGAGRAEPPIAAAIYTGKHVAEDPNRTRADEIVGFIVIEAGVGDIQGIAYQAAVGNDTIRGTGDSPPYSYTFAQPFTTAPAVAIVSQAAMDGANGGWVPLVGANPLQSNAMSLAVEEDQIRDSERNHTTEQAAYIVFEETLAFSGGSPVNQPPSLVNPGDQLHQVGETISLSINATDANGDTLTFSATNLPDGLTIDTATGLIAGTLTETSIGNHTVTVSVSDGIDSDTTSFTWDVQAISGLKLETVVTSGIDSSGWTTVNLSNTYDDMVVACVPTVNNNTIPVVVRMQNATGNSLQLRLQNPSGASLVAETVHCLVVEAGAWELPDGRKLEAQKYNSTVTDDKSSWVGEAQTYLNSYNNPVVVGQVMSYNDPNWSTFWSRGTGRAVPPSAAALYTGKQVAEDTNQTRSAETIGFIVIEAGQGTVGSVAYEATLGADTVAGIGNNAPYAYSLQQSFTASPAVAVVSQAAMDGNNGGWAVLAGPTPIQSNQLSLLIDEDQISDSERSHTTEQVGYIVFEQNVVIGGP